MTPTTPLAPRLRTFAALLFSTVVPAFVQAAQWVEGFDQVQFHHGAERAAPTRDFRGNVRGYMTAGWWAHGQLKDNRVSWKTAAVPAKESTTFAFVGSSFILPAEFSRRPSARLKINGRHALIFTLGFTRDVTWQEGDFQLKYISRRVEYPYFGSHRQLELHGNSGIYQLTVPASAVEAGQPAVIEVELQPFAGWQGGWFMVKERRDTLKPSPASLEGEVETLRQDMATINQLTHILGTRAYDELTNTHDLQHSAIYSPGFRHVHPADLIMLQNGELLLMTREGSEHYSDDGEVVLLRSTDGGTTWGDRQVIGGAELDEREGCGVQLRDGTIVVGIFYNNLYNPDGTYNFNEGEKISELDRRYLGVYAITSKDNGRTWSKPYVIDTAGMPFGTLAGPTDAPIEMPDGSIIMGVIGYPRGEGKNRSSVMLRSTDQGRTWGHLSTIAADPGGLLGGFVEPGIVRTKTGRIVAGLRNSGPDHAIWMAHSDDDGRTWSPAKKTAMIGHPVDLVQLSDGRLMATYGIRTGPHTRPGGVRVCFSSDNGETWDIQTEIQLRNDFINWDTGYPESLELPDGRMLTVYYYNLFGKYHVGATTWKL